MTRVAVLLVVTAAGTAAWLASAQAARNDDPVLTAVVGTNDGYVISLADPNGAPFNHLDPGTYTVVVHDRSALHNFHLVGPGVDKATSIFAVGDVTWTVTFADGYYRFRCDPHPTMKGDFTVGAGQRPPIALTGVVGTGGVALKDATAARVSKLVTGRYVLTVRDTSQKDNFHLRGPGIERSTSLAFRGSVRWPIVLKDGVYRYWSDSHPTVRHTVKVTAGTWGG